jgi:hypothetical protein
MDAFESSLIEATMLRPKSGTKQKDGIPQQKQTSKEMILEADTSNLHDNRILIGCGKRSAWAKLSL